MKLVTKSSWMLVLVMLAMVCAPGFVFAEDDDDDDEYEDEEYDSEEPAEEEQPADEGDQPNTRVGIQTYWGDEEIEEVKHGFFLEMKPGARFFAMGDYADVLGPGFSAAFALGYDIVPKWFTLGLDLSISTHAASGIYDEQGSLSSDAAVEGDALIFIPALMAEGHYFWDEKRSSFNYGVFVGGAMVNNGEASNLDMDGVAGLRLGLDYHAGLRGFAIGLDLDAGYIFSAASLFVNVGPSVRYTF